MVRTCKNALRAVCDLSTPHRVCRHARVTAVSGYYSGRAAVPSEGLGDATSANQADATSANQVAKVEAATCGWGSMCEACAGLYDVYKVKCGRPRERYESIRWFGSQMMMLFGATIPT